MQPSNEKILEDFKQRLTPVIEDDIFKLNDKNKGELNNVVVGIAKECFLTISWNTDKPDFDYFLFYINRSKSGKLQGWNVRLTCGLKHNIQLTYCFVSFIKGKFKLESVEDIYNAYQHQVRTMYENLDYWTYTNHDLKELKGREGLLMVPQGYRGIVYLLFADKVKEEKKEVPKVAKPQPSNKIKTPNKVQTATNFVYIMHNKLNGYYKIGRSIKPEYRERTLQAQEPDVVLLETWQVGAHIETILKRKYKHKRKRGEWFILTIEDIEEIRNYMKKLPTNRTN